MNIEMLQKRQAQLTEKFEKQIKDNASRSGYQKDPRFWENPKDGSGNGYAVIRFLPPPPDPKSPDGVEDFAFIRKFTYGFKGPTGKWYIETSLRTIGQDDPVNDYNRRLYATKEKLKEEDAKTRPTRTRFIANILVIDDPARPENNGKVFLYEYNKKINDMINEAFNPKFPDEDRIEAFSFTEGADFKLKIRKIGEFPNYDKSEFGPKSALFGGDLQKLEKIWNQEYSLKEFIDPKNFKSYAELERKFHEVMGMASGTRTQRDLDHEEPIEKYTAPREEPTPQAKTQAPHEPASNALPEDEEDEMAFFKRAAGMN